MGTDVYGKRKMYNGGALFILFIPIGAIALFFLYDFCMNIYKQRELNIRTEEVLTDALNRADFDSLDEMKIYVAKVFEEYGMSKDDFSLMQFDDYYLLTAYNQYISVIGELSFGLIRNKESVVSASYKGYYNEYKEVVVEKYKENIDDEISDDNSTNENDEIIIK